MNQPKLSTIKRCGLVWVPWDDGWTATMHARFHLRTWKFGAIHQCAIDAVAPASRDGSVRVCLAAQLTRDAAMRHARRWVDAYALHGPKSVEATMRECFVDWKTLYRTRQDVINSLFFMIGCGQDWLDGAILRCRPEDHLESQEEKPRRRALLLEEDPSRRAYYDRIDAEEAALPIGPVSDDAPRSFYPVSDYSRIARVPDDVRPDWLALAYEAARMLRDSSLALTDDGLAPNRAWGAKVVADLERRFPHACVPGAAR